MKESDIHVICVILYPSVTQMGSDKATTHEGVRYPCEQCDIKLLNFQLDLRRHKVTVHEGIKYPCNQCDVKLFSSKDGLKNTKPLYMKVLYIIDIIASMHYDLCNVTPFSGQNGLSQNKSKVHEVIRYECNSYDYKAPRNNILNNMQ